MTPISVESLRLPAARQRAGVTLTEILFAILVMGVGLLSVLSLFPIGLLNVARAVQLSRAGAYASAALGDLQVQGLLHEERYRFGPVNGPLSPDPLLQDPRLNSPFVADHGVLRDFVDNGVDGTTDNFEDLVASGAAIARPGERGLPVAIDPLFIRRVVVPRIGTTLPADLPPVPVPVENRLGVLRNAAGVILNWGIQRSMPTDQVSTDGERQIDAFDGGVAPNGVIDSLDSNGDNIPDDAYPDGLNSVTLRLFAPVPPDSPEQYLSQLGARDVFGSRDDITFRETDPDPTINEQRKWMPLNDATGVPLREQKYTSLVTAYLPDAGDPTRYEASAAVFFNRDFLPTGERTLLAYYLPQPGTGPGNLTNPVQPSNQVILMWLASQSTPEVPKEGWFLDASHDANAAQWSTMAAPPGPGRQFWPHRAFWYKIVDRGDPQTGYIDAIGNFIPFDIGGAPAVRQLITLDRPVREVTPSFLPGNTIN